MRETKTGATRNNNDYKYPYWKFLSSRVMRRFGKYMQSHRVQSDGKVRDGDNWKKGLEKDWYIESLSRHIHNVWELDEEGKAFDFDGNPVDWEDALCGVMFNSMGLLFEILKEKKDD